MASSGRDNRSSTPRASDCPLHSAIDPPQSEQESAAIRCLSAVLRACPVIRDCAKYSVSGNAK